MEKSVSASPAPARVELLDAVRGFALMGLFLVHSVEQYELFWSHPDYGAVFQWDFGLFSGKAYAMMALCFGSVFTLSCKLRLRAIGLVHGLIYRGDFLQTIAITGFLMLPLDRIKSNSALLWLAALCLLQIPLLVRAWAAAQGYGWAIANPLY